MARVELPIISHNGSASLRFGEATRRSAAVQRPRDMYADVPILQEPTWGNEIAAYFYLGGVSSGAALLGSLASLFGGKERQSLAHTAHYVAFATMLPCPALLIMDLGKRSRFHHMLRIFKPSSPMNFGAWILTMDGMFTTLAALRALGRERQVPVLTGVARFGATAVVEVLDMPPALGLGGYTGVLIGTTSIPVWYTSPLIGALFMASALSTGIAATSLAGSLLGREGPTDQRLLAGLERTAGIMEMGLLSGYLATTGSAAKPLLRGKFGAMLGGAVAASSAAVALAGLGRKGDEDKRRRLGRSSAALTLVGGALLRWSIVLAGKASARDREGTLQAMTPSQEAPGWGNGRP